VSHRKTAPEIGVRGQYLRLISLFRLMWDVEIIKRNGITERLEFAAQAGLALKSVESIKQSVTPTTR
jgi:hypothetical protein